MSVDTRISDLFFNHQHRCWDEWWRSQDDPASLWEFPREAVDAIESDAEEFVADFGDWLGVTDATELAEDFMRRI